MDSRSSWWRWSHTAQTWRWWRGRTSRTRQEWRRGWWWRSTTRRRWRWWKRNSSYLKKTGHSFWCVKDFKEVFIFLPGGGGGGGGGGGPLVGDSRPAGVRLPSPAGDKVRLSDCLRDLLPLPGSSRCDILACDGLRNSRVNSSFDSISDAR